MTKQETQAERDQYAETYWQSLSGLRKAGWVIAYIMWTTALPPIGLIICHMMYRQNSIAWSVNNGQYAESGW